MTICKRFIIFFVLITMVAMAEANPIPWPMPASMPLEDMYSSLDETNDGNLRETFVGNYYFSYIPEEVNSMKYPVPLETDGISVAMGKLPEDWEFSPDIFPSLHETPLFMQLKKWFYNGELYPTVLPEWPRIPMIEWNGPFPEKALLSVRYQHDLLKRGHNFIYFYALGTGKYYQTYQKEAISYLDISMPTKYNMYRLFLDNTPHAFAVTCEKDELEEYRRVVSIFASAQFGPFKKDIIGYINYLRVAPAEVANLPPQIRLRYKVEQCGTIPPSVIRPNIIPSGKMMIVTDNIFFNCCPEYVRMAIHVQGNNVTFFEKAMEEAPCNCICYYPMKGEAGPFTPGTYHAKLINPYGKILLEKEIVISPLPPCEGDFDRDRDVDGADLAIFAADFGRTDCPVSSIIIDEIDSLKEEIKRLENELAVKDEEITVLKGK